MTLQKELLCSMLASGVLFTICLHTFLSQPYPEQYGTSLLNVASASGVFGSLAYCAGKARWVVREQQRRDMQAEANAIDI